MPRRSRLAAWPPTRWCSSQRGTRKRRCPTSSRRRDATSPTSTSWSSTTAPPTTRRAWRARAARASCASTRTAGCRWASPPATAQRSTRGYQYCGRLDADGQHPAAELARMLERVRAGECDVAIGSRFLPESGEEGGRYQPPVERVVGTSLRACSCGCAWARDLGRHERPVRGGPAALALLADPYVSESPEVEALVRIAGATCACSRCRYTSPARARELVLHRPPRRGPGGVDRAHAVRGRAAAPSLPAPGEEEAGKFRCRSCRSSADQPRPERQPGDAAGVGRAGDLPPARERPQDRRAAASLASRSRCEARPPKAAHPCTGPATTAGDPAEAHGEHQRVGARGRPSPRVHHATGRRDRAATTWSRSITVPATTAVTSGPRPFVWAAAPPRRRRAAPWANGSAHARSVRRNVMHGVVRGLPAGRIRVPPRSHRGHGPRT